MFSCNCKLRYSSRTGCLFLCTCWRAERDSETFCCRARYWQCQGNKESTDHRELKEMYVRQKQNTAETSSATSPKSRNKGVDYQNATESKPLPRQGHVCATCCYEYATKGTLDREQNVAKVIFLSLNLYGRRTESDIECSPVVAVV